MQVHVARTLDDIRHVKELMAGDTWGHARTFLSEASADPLADHLRWFEEGGRPVSCVQIFLHQYPIGCATVGMCLPEYPFVPPALRGQGHFRRLMTDLFEWMRDAGYPLAYDHGRKGLYTNLGYAPCFHHCVALIRVAEAVNVLAPSRAEIATEDDVVASEELFRRPFPLGRGLQCADERWRPEPEATLLVRDGRGAVAGFMVATEHWLKQRPEQGRERLNVPSSWSRDIRAAAVLLRTAAEEASRRNSEWIWLNCRRTDPLARLCVLAGGELRWCAGQERDHTEREDVDSFYLADLRLAVEQLLPELAARWTAFTGHAPPSLHIRMEDESVVLGLAGPVELLPLAANSEPCLRLSRKAMTRAIMGYATPTELSLLHEDCSVPDECRAAADALFGAREPHLTHEGWAFAKMTDYGLVP